MIFSRFLTMFLFTAGYGLGGFKVPDSVLPAEKINEGQALAKKENKALAFVYTEAGST